ncbi:MAG: DVU_1553 family AMP-dependent CoA ligase [Clostridiaceae bacterium]|nr:AMP-binding protein [Eubacteriales bacterium]
MGCELCCLEAWIGAKICVPKLSLKDIRAYQLAAVERVLNYVVQSAPFYRERFRGAPEVRSFSDFERLPLLTADELISNGQRMLCVEQEHVCRVYTSGTTAAPKRLRFTEAELEATVEYFTEGSRQFLRRGERALLLFPCEAENGAAQLFLRALKRLGAEGIPYGIPADGAEACRAVLETMPSLILAAPATALSMLACGENLSFDTLLVSGDALSEDAARLLRERFHCDVFQQYGLTESAFGLGVDCRAFHGYHLRETDYYVEIADEKGKALPTGEFGRVVITSLLCGAMPLIRYDTGDIGRYLSEPCACGSVLPLLDRIRPRDVAKGYHGGSDSPAVPGR